MEVQRIIIGGNMNDKVFWIAYVIGVIVTIIATVTIAIVFQKSIVLSLLQ